MDNQRAKPVEARRFSRNPRDQDDRELHARLLNWARWARTKFTPGDRAGLSPDEIDAQTVEAALCRMKAKRTNLYLVLWQVYMRRRDDVTGSETLRCSVAEYKRRLRRAYDWLHGFLTEREP